MTTPSDWLKRFRDSKGDTHAAKKLPRLPLKEISGLATQSGVHPDVLGPCRRAAASLKWLVMVRPIKVAAMCLVGEYNKLPKPMAIKAKCNKITGMVMFENEAALEAFINCNDIQRSYATVNGLRLAEKPKELRLKNLYYLVNDKGQCFFSDMDLYEVLDSRTGDQITLGSGNVKLPNEGAGGRAELDKLINILKDRGTDFNLIQHGPQRQWEKHVIGTPSEEAIATFCPDGEVLIIPGGQVEPFIAQFKEIARKQTNSPAP
jgi:hypothetical protein